MHVFRRARVPLACLPHGLATGATGPDPAIEPWKECDLTVEGNRLTAVTPAASVSRMTDGHESTDLRGAMVFPGLLDVHTHLDKAHTWDRAPNPRGEFWDAIRILGADSRNWTEADLLRRAEFCLKRAEAHGTVALRTHVDTGAMVGEAAHSVMQHLRGTWRDRIILQTVSLCNMAAFAQGERARIVEITRRYQATALGGFPQPNPDLDRQLDVLMAAAMDLGIGLDLHVDESGLKEAECLRATADAVKRNRFPHPVACGHCCSLAVHEPARAADTLARVKDAGIQIIALPLCNLYLQDRQGAPRTPRWRGLTLIHEFMDAGVTVACASDNVRDAFYAWGDLDPLEVYQQSVRIGHLDTRLAASPAVVTTAPADIMGLAKSGYGRVAPGAPARLVVFPVRTFNELLSRPGLPRRLLRGERLVTLHGPDLRELAI